MPINEVAVTAVIATPELISPGDATEAGADGLELVEGPDQLGFAVGPGKLRAECGVGKGAAISALETETNTVKAGIRTRASTNLFIKISSILLMCVGLLCTGKSSSPYVRYLMFPEYLGIIQTDSPQKL
jgi:hypothetical protein